MPMNPAIVLSMINTPRKFFRDPNQVLKHPNLRRSDRIDILRSWKHDLMSTRNVAQRSEKLAGNRELDLINEALDEGAFEQQTLLIAHNTRKVI